jgi:hypothetical protein
MSRPCGRDLSSQIDVMTLSRQTLEEITGGRQPDGGEILAMVHELLSLRDEQERDGTVAVHVEGSSFDAFPTRLPLRVLHAGARVTMGGRIYTIASMDEPVGQGPRVVHVK